MRVLSGFFCRLHLMHLMQLGVLSLKQNLKSFYSCYFQTSDGGHTGGQAHDQGVQVVGVGGMGGLDLDSGAEKLNIRMVTVLLLVSVLFSLL